MRLALDRAVASEFSSKHLHCSLAVLVRVAIMTSYLCVAPAGNSTITKISESLNLQHLNYNTSTTINLIATPTRSYEIDRHSQRTLANTSSSCQAPPPTAPSNPPATPPPATARATNTPNQPSPTHPAQPSTVPPKKPASLPPRKPLASQPAAPLPFKEAQTTIGGSRM